ncbi:MAG: ZIP family metal transporter [Betaproteobacteria bacterium]
MNGPGEAALAMQVFWAALATDFATGLGALPFAFLKETSARWQGFAAAGAGGMMLSASVFALADKALRAGNALEVIAGMLAGALFFAVSAKLLAETGWCIRGLSASDSRKSVLLITTMFVHSIPEGIAIGVGYATGELRFGVLLATAIAVHNVPEGTAVSLPLRAKGASVNTCFWYSVLTSVPQPLLAVPAFLLIAVFRPLLPASLGFAGGSMIFLVTSELIPDSLAHCTRSEAAWGVTLGLVAMLGFMAALAL